MSITTAHSYTHMQDVAANTWTISHALNCYPVVQVFVNYGGALQRVEPLSIKALDENTVEVAFTAAQTGKVNLF